MDAVMAIAVSEARSACAGEPDIVERIRKAMRACHDHWMVTAEGQQLNAALAAAALESPPEEKDRVLRSGRAFNDANNVLAALINGVPVDVEALSERQRDRPDDIIPIGPLWTETKRKG